MEDNGLYNVSIGYIKLVSACEVLVRDSYPFEPDKILCNIADIRRILRQIQDDKIQTMGG